MSRRRSWSRSAEGGRSRSPSPGDTSSSGRRPPWWGRRSNTPGRAGAGHPLRVGGREPGGGPGPAAGESRGGGARLDAAAGAGPDPVHDRLGVGAGRRPRSWPSTGGGAVGGELGAARDQPDQVRGPGPRRPESPQDDGMGRPLSDHARCDATRRRSNDSGGADGLAGAGDQRRRRHGCRWGIRCWTYRGAGVRSGCSTC